MASSSLSKAAMASRMLSKAAVGNATAASNAAVSKRTYIYGATAIPVAKYGGRYTVTMMPGDGIGPEMMGYVRDIFKVAGAPIDFETVLLDPSQDNYDDLNNAISSIQRNGCGIKGNIETKMNRPDIKSRNVEMRNVLDLYVNVIRAQSQPGLKTRHADIDVVMIRQNTEGEYAMLEHENAPGVVESLKITTEPHIERLCRYAFQYAQENDRKKVTCVHKANIMKVTDGLFLEIAKRVSRDYPKIEFQHMIVDNTCMQLVSNPWQFDVMLLTNLYGTIVTNLICGLIGGPGIISGGNFGDNYAVFEPGTRNTGTKLVGTNTANPCAMINASADMLEHLNLDYHSNLIKNAVNQTVNEDLIHTADLGGTASSTDVVNNIIEIIRKETRN